MKQKTTKAAKKRFTFTAKGKAKRQSINQAHFNARDNGDERRRKHGQQSVDSTNNDQLKRLIPYK